MNQLLLPLENTVRDYPWGSHTALATLRGERAPSAGPEAELWMGAHPSAPSKALEDGSARSLLELVEAEPVRALGASSHARFGPRLPFLLKLLAAAEPLSLQAHPSLEQARRGFAREEAAGIPRDAPHRNYKDDNHKPELLAALTPFHALVGFRAVPDTLRLFELLAAEPLRPLIEALRTEPAELGLRAFFQLTLSAAPERREAIARSTLAGCERLRETTREFAREVAWGVRIAQKYPGDPGLALALALNLVVLEPGQAIYLPAGNLHAYLEGTGVEIMASSDNVLRGGLTPKYVDVPELLAVLDFRAGPVELVPVERRAREVVYRTPAPDFSLSRFELDGDSAVVGPVKGPEIIVVTHGTVNARRRSDSLSLASGASAFIPATGGDYTLEGSATVFRARVNSP